MWVYGLDCAGPGQRQVADACECGNEPSCCVKCGEQAGLPFSYRLNETQNNEVWRTGINSEPHCATFVTQIHPPYSFGDIGCKPRKFARLVIRYYVQCHVNEDMV